MAALAALRVHSTAHRRLLRGLPGAGRRAHRGRGASCGWAARCAGWCTRLGRDHGADRPGRGHRRRAGQLRRPAVPTGSPPPTSAGSGRRRTRGSCRSGASTTSCAPRRRHLVTGADLPGARSAVPVPRRAPDPDGRRQRACRSERGAGAGPGGLPVAHRPSARRGRDARLPRFLAAGPAQPASRPDGGGPVAVARSGSPASLARLVPAITARRSGAQPGRRAGPGAALGRRAGRRLPDPAARPAACTCSTRPSPAATSSLEIGNHIATLAVQP